MKTAISINDDLYLEAEQTAHQLSLSRSKLYALALYEYLQTHKPEAITARLNEIYSHVDSHLDDAFAQANYDLVSQEDW